MAQAVDLDFHPEAVFTCLNCNSVYTMGATVSSMNLEVCGNCHPFYTGNDTILDTTGRIERFNQRLAKAQSLKADGKDAKKKKKKIRKISQTLEDLEKEEQD